MDHRDSSIALSSAIQGVYAAFADAPRPRSIDGCPCCLDDKDIDALISTPLCELTPKVVGFYASSVFLTVGGRPDFNYLLPRILEILVTEQHWWPDPEVVGRAIHDSDYEHWPAARRHAVEHYFESGFAAILNSEIDFIDAESWLCMLGHVGVDLRPFLDGMLAFPSQVAELFASLNQALSRGRALGGFWEPIPDSAQVVVEWIHSEPVRRIVHEQWGVTL